MKKNIFLQLSILFTALFIVQSVAYGADMTGTNFVIRDPVVNSGGSYGTSTNFRLTGSSEWILNDRSTSTNFRGRFGFLPFPTVDESVLVGVANSSSADLTWNAATANNGFIISGYETGIATVSGGPYTYTNVGSVTSYSYTTLTPGTYYFVLRTLDAFGNVIAVSNEETVTIAEIISIALSANSVTFGPLSPGSPRYATTSSGSSVNTSAHTISTVSNASGGYVLLYSGGTLASGANTISDALISGSASGTPGTEQFAVSLSATGAANITSGYDQSSLDWAFDPGTSKMVAYTSAPSAGETFDAHYIANAGALTPSGQYATTLMYTITANY